MLLHRQRKQALSHPANLQIGALSQSRCSFRAYALALCQKK